MSKRGVCDFTAEPWTKRVVFREEIEDHCGLAVSITEPVSVQKVRRFLRLTAKCGAEEIWRGKMSRIFDFQHLVT